MRHRHGFTLLEIMVVLVLMGLASALVAPSLLPPQRSADDAVSSLIDAARRAAVQRAGPVTLTFFDGDRWELAAPGTPSRAGEIDWPYQETVRIRINALGACMLEVDAETAAFTMDAARCRLQR